MLRFCLIPAINLHNLHTIMWYAPYCGGWFYPEWPSCCKLLLFAAADWAQLWNSLIRGGSQVGIWRRGSLEGQKGRFLNVWMVEARPWQQLFALCRRPASNYSSLFQCSYIHTIERQTVFSLPPLPFPPLPALQSTLRCLSPEHFSQADPSIAAYKVSKTDSSLM